MGDWATSVMQWIAVAALIAMMVHLCLDIGLRNLAGLPLDGTLEIVADIYMPFVVFAAIAATHFRKEEIRVDLVGNVAPEKVVKWLDRAAQLLLIGAALALAWLTARHALHAFEIHERIEAGSLVIPAWPGKAVVPVGFVLLALAAVCRLLGKAADDSV